MIHTFDYGSYSSFKETVDTLKERLTLLRQYCDSLGLDNTSQSISNTIDKVASEHFEVAIVGEFKRGKSTLINAILGKEILPADVLPATATLNRVTYSERPYVTIEYKNGEKETVDISELENYVTKLSYESEKKAETIKEATVYYDTDFCRNNVDIIDTPGLNDDEQMTNVTLSILPEIDAAVFVISANSPFSQFEKEFLEKKMLTSDLGRIIFAVNCFGTFAREDEERIVETVRKRIGQYVMDKAKAVMGEDSKEFAVYKRKIGMPKVIGVYAKKALCAKQAGDEAMLSDSNFPTFEHTLETLLTKDRGSITLQILANKIISAGSELINSIVLRESALLMEADEFLEKYQNAIDEIEDIRTKKREEFVRINDAANKAFTDLQPIIDDYWIQIEETAIQVIDDFPMTSDDLKRDRMKMVNAKLTEKIRESIETKAQLICEQIQNEINIALSDETERLQTFEDEFFASIARIQSMFSVPDRRVNQVIGTAIGSVINLGTGGLFVGFREAGIKGALLGGITGFAGFYATFFAAIYLAGALGIAAAGPVTLCIIAIAGIAGTFSGKFSVDKLLVQERIDKYKLDFKNTVKKQFREMKINSDFSETVRQQVFNSFEGLKSKLESETEVILEDTQKTLDSLNTLKAEQKELSDSEREWLKDVAEYVGTLLAESYGLYQTLTNEASGESSEETQTA